jgi:NhaP-type Na+/H+ or K+/H+ antiporter
VLALAVLRGLAAIAGLTLLSWAWIMLDNIWTYNDSGTLTYVLFALMVGIPGVTLVAAALLLGRLRR